MRIVERLEANPRLALIAAFALAALLAAVDFSTGVQVSFSIFYLIPVALAAWCAGPWAGVALSVACATAWAIFDAHGQHYTHPLIPVWNGTMRGMIFGLVTLLLVRLRRSHHELIVAYEQLDRTRTEQLRLKDRLLSHVSHELRTPLTALHQFVTIVLDRIPGELNAQQDEYLRIAARNAEALAVMISDLLDATRIEAATLSVHAARMPLAPVVSEVLRTLRSRALEAGVTLEAPVLDGVPEVSADAARVRQVLINLVDNAVKFTPSGGRVRVHASVDASEPGHVRVTVSDTGRGIAPEDVSRLFQRLFQAGSETQSRNGLGLGLFICRELVLRQGGRIWVESAPGAGSRFSFTLPVAAVEAVTEGATA